MLWLYVRHWYSMHHRKEITLSRNWSFSNCRSDTEYSSKIRTWIDHISSNIQSLLRVLVDGSVILVLHSVDPSDLIIAWYPIGIICWQHQVHVPWTVFSSLFPNHVRLLRIYTATYFFPLVLFLSHIQQVYCTRSRAATYRLATAT